MKKSGNQESCWELIKEVYRGLESEWNSIGKKYFQFPRTLPIAQRDVEILDSYEGKAIFSVSANGRVGTIRLPLLLPLASSETGIELTVERNQYLYDSIENCSRVEVKDSQAKAIILEEASYYFSGVKPLDEVVKIIADRIGTKISE